MHITEVHDKRILYAALDWGLGHVTRSIGIIRQLERQGNTVIVACNPEQKQVFVSYLPELIYEALEGYNLRFSGRGNWAWDLWKQRGRFLKAISMEKQRAQDLCIKHGIELLVSDHRYGFRSDDIPSVFVTHQLHLPLPQIAFLVQNWHEKRLREFSSLWVLDDAANSLAGKLSKPVKHPDLGYMGWYSRFESSDSRDKNAKILFDYLIVLSGPEPYSRQLLQEIPRKIDLSDKKVAVLHPASLKKIPKQAGFKYFPAKELKKNDVLFYQSEAIISRSGYSTLMDLKVLDKKALLFPAKGQQEQEYLFRYLQLEKGF